MRRFSNRLAIRGEVGFPNAVVIDANDEEELKEMRNIYSKIMKGTHPRLGMKDRKTKITGKKEGKKNLVERARRR